MFYRYNVVEKKENETFNLIYTKNFGFYDIRKKNGHKFHPKIVEKSWWS